MNNIEMSFKHCWKGYWEQKRHGDLGTFYTQNSSFPGRHRGSWMQLCD